MQTDLVQTHTTQIHMHTATAFLSLLTPSQLHCGWRPYACAADIAAANELVAFYTDLYRRVPVDAEHNRPSGTTKMYF